MRRNPPKDNVRLVRSTGSNYRGLVANNSGELLQYESYRELVIIITLLRNSDIDRIVSQPLSIEFRGKRGKPRRYTPDLLVYFPDGSVEVHEVTLEYREERDDIRERHQAALEHCEARGWGFVTWTEVNFPSQTEQANLQAVFAFRHPRNYSADIEAVIKGLLDNVASMTYREIESAVLQQVRCSILSLRAASMHMIWRGELEIDWNKLLFLMGKPDPRARVWLPGADE